MKRVWVDQDKCMGCKTCELQCAVERNSVTKELKKAVKEEPKPVARVSVFGTKTCIPIQCRHCENAPCIKVCPSGAAQRDKEKGYVFIDQEKCRGCWMCVMICPFGAVIPTEYKVAVKCDACMHMEEPACVASCPTGALSYGDEMDYGKVLAKKRGRIAAFVADTKICLDFVREDD